MKRKRCTKRKPLTAAEMAREVERLVGPDALNIMVWSDSLFMDPAIEHEGEAAHMMSIYVNRGSVAKQLHAECQRVARIYHDLAIRIQARVWQDEIDAEVAAERKAAC